MTFVHFVVPAELDDSAKPTGGNIYDRRIFEGLSDVGWQVIKHAAPGSWPWPDAAAEHALARLISWISDGAVVLIDDLIASTVPDILVPEAGRLRLVVLVHMSLGEAPPGHQVADAETREGAVLSAVSAVSNTSWPLCAVTAATHNSSPPPAVPAAKPAGSTPGAATYTLLGGNG